MKKILIVEPDADVRTDIAAALADEYLVRSASSTHEAVDLLRSGEVDVVLLDIFVNSAGGFMVFGRIAGMHPKPRTIILSVVNEAEKAAKLMKLGAEDYLVKPCDVNVVRGAVRQALGAEM